MRPVLHSIVLGVVLGSSALGCSRPDAASESSEKKASPATPAASSSAPAVATPPTPAPPAPAPAAVVAPTPNTLRLVVLHDSELFTSEKNHIASLQKHIEKDGPVVNAVPPTDDERAYATALAAKPDAPGAIPSAWNQFETVVVLRIEPPRDVGSQKMSGGRSLLSILHPPATIPAFSTIYAEKGAPGAPSIDGARLGVWIRNHLTFRKAAP